MPFHHTTPDLVTPEGEFFFDVGNNGVDKATWELKLRAPTSSARALRQAAA